MNENPSPTPLVDGSHVAPANGGGTVESPSVSLAELSKVLGTDFKDPSTALKAIQDTKSYVGKRKEDIAKELASQQPQVDTASKSDVQSLRNDLFISQNPQYKDYVNVLQKISPNLAEAAADAGFKVIFEKVKAADEVAQNKSVVSSNQRLSQTKSTIDNAVTVANARGTTQEDVALVFAREINASAQ